MGSGQLALQALSQQGAAESRAEPAWPGLPETQEALPIFYSLGGKPLRTHTAEMVWCKGTARRARGRETSFWGSGGAKLLLDAKPL